MLGSIVNYLKDWFSDSKKPIELLDDELKRKLSQQVAFYQQLNESDKVRFERRCIAFINATEFIGHDVEVTEFDRLLVAAGSVILAWGFNQWHYVKVDAVILVSGSFNENSEFGKSDSNITGLVGTHHLAGKMILSQPALHYGFSNDMDKRNVAIHEFAHLIDIADGDCDGMPRELLDNAFCLPWLSLVEKGINDINEKNSDIRQYGATNRVEFFAVVSEYFFERPKMLLRKHPGLYKSLEVFYKQNRAELQKDLKIRKKAPCPCGSGKRYKRCCLLMDSDKSIVNKNN